MAKLRRVEYFRLWLDRTWDTAYIEIPGDTMMANLDAAVRRAVKEAQKKGESVPLLVGFYSLASE
jgi:hypothetical protein